MFDWTDEIIATMRHLYENGIPASGIARRIGVSRNAVIGKISRLGWPWENGQPSRMSGADTVRAVSARLRSERDAFVRHGHAAGMTVRDLADKHGVSVQVISAVGRRIGVSFRSPPVAKAASKPADRFVAAFDALAAPVTDGGVTILKLEPDHCRYPLWSGKPDSRDSRYCGEPVETSVNALGRTVRKSWCPHHRLVCTTPNNTPGGMSKARVLERRL
jgi:hypothetical protein